jgi:hypothetical protein
VSDLQRVIGVEKRKKRKEEKKGGAKTKFSEDSSH